MSTPTEPAGTDHVAQLRRRLYQPSASDDDVDRYRTAAAAVAPPPPGAPVTRPLRRRWVLAAVVAAPTVAIAVGLGADATRSRPTPGPVTTVAPTEQRTTPAPYSFQQVAASSEPLSLVTTDTGAGVSFAGIGPGTIPLDRSTLSDHGGLLQVEMLTDTSGAVGWRMDRIATRADFSSYDETLAHGPARQEMAAVTPVRVEYDGSPSTTIRVDAPVGTRWWLDLRLARRSG